MQLYIKEHSRPLKIQGIIMLMLGIVAIIVPGLFTLAIELLIGILLLVGGLMSIYGAFKLKGLPTSTISMLTGILSAIVGALLLVYPMQGVIALTILLGVLFLFKGVAEIVTAFQHRHWVGWGWILASGIASILIALVLLLALPESAVWGIGLLVGINLLFTGTWLLMLGSAISKGLEI